MFRKIHSISRFQNYLGKISNSEGGNVMSLVKLSPIIVLAGLMLSGMDILLSAPLATIVAVALAMLIDKFSFNEVFNAAIDNVKTFIIVFFIRAAAGPA